MEQTQLPSYLKFILAVLVSELAGIIGAVFTVSAIPAWYAALQKPLLAPPNWVFGPVWTGLYLLMGVAAFLVWRKEPQRPSVRPALAIFGIQLVLNAVWSVLFFGLRSPAWALAEIVFLWFAILWTMLVFYKISKPAAWLLLPYILWVSFAVYLNYAIWTLN